MEEWTDFLMSPEVSNDFKIIIKKFLMPNNISVKQFYINLESHQGGDAASAVRLYATKSLLFLIVIPPFYPDWFIAGFPDVLLWLLNDPKRSNVYNALNDNMTKELLNDEIKKKDFLEKLVNEYINTEEATLECTDRYKSESELKKLEYPKEEFDEFGRLKIKKTLLDGFINYTEYTYNDNNLVIRIDSWGENGYGKWKLTPNMLFDYEEDGLLKRGVKFIHGGKTESIYVNKYNENGDLIDRSGLYEVSIFKVVDSQLHMNYLGEYVDILIFNKFHVELNCEKFSLLEKVKKEELIAKLNSYVGYENIK
jgi:hypothetical protein